MISHEVRVIDFPVLSPGVPSSPSIPSPGAEGDPEAQPATAVIDVLRATTTLTRAFSRGASEALFFSTPDSARQARDESGESRDLLCGEREGRRIPGFDLGNSPFEYSRDRVEGRRLLFASTNGSGAFLASASAPIQWSVAFVNISAAVRALSEFLLEEGGATGRDLQIVCAGKEGRPAEEDLLCAALLLKGVGEVVQSAGQVLTRTGAIVPNAPRDPAHTEELLRATEHGEFLCSLGDEFVRDVRYCAAWDELSNLPTGNRGRLTR